MATPSILPINEIPLPLRPIAHFVKIANDYANRDIVIYYWCLLKAVEDAMKMDSGSQDSKKFIVTMMNVLEQVKQQNKENDAIMQDLVAQSHIEDQAQRLFQYAESQDKSGQFNQKMMKAFYTCGYLFDVLSIFGTLDENIQSARKYAKWRAAYIAGCIKRGEQLIPGNKAAKSDDPSQINDELSAELNALNTSIGQVPSQQQPQPTQSQMQQPTQPKDYGYGFLPPQGQQQFDSTKFDGAYSSSSALTGLNVYPGIGFGLPTGQQPQPTNQFGNGIKPGLQESPFQKPLNPSPPTLYNSPAIKPRIQPQQINPSVGQQSTKPTPPATIEQSAAQNLKLEDYLEAKKYTKFASSALDYEDPKTAIDYLQKAIAVLQKHQ